MNPSDKPPPQWVGWLQSVRDLGFTLRDLPSWMSASSEFPAQTPVPMDFLGVNIATSDDTRCDDYVIEALRQLGIRQVRLHYSYPEHQGQHAQRLLERCLSEDLQVMLAILPPREEARRMTVDPAVQKRWRAFVSDLLTRYGAQLECVEVGNTPNRGKWSGYSLPSYLQTWQIAAEVAGDFDIRLAGPNVSDFEPFYNAALLRGMRRVQRAPLIHTENLFVERVGEPEKLDRRVMGRWLARVGKINLVKKINIMVSAGTRGGAQQNYCTYTCWTRRRLGRWSVIPETKGADYLVRYVSIAAAAGTLNRLYWGPLIDHRDGLVDCGDLDYPHIDNVTFYDRVRGSVDDFVQGETYHAIGHMRQLLNDAQCIQAYSHHDRLSHFVFSYPDGTQRHLAWSVDRTRYTMQSLYPQGIGEATCYCATGATLSSPPVTLTEHPIVLHWPASADATYPDLETLASVEPLGPRGTVFGVCEPYPIVDWHESGWQGVIAVPNQADPRSYSPERLNLAPVKALLRDKRNKLWNVVDAHHGEITIKLNRAKGIKRLTYRFLPSKAQRHWNNATEMLRRGIGTPQPLAYFERPHQPGITDNYYVCRFIPNAFSCRQLFAAFGNGDDSYRGIHKDRWLSLVGAFVGRMHANRVLHRDLSSGNILMTLNEQQPSFYLVDIGRTRFDPERGFTNLRMKDLNRICYKLAWPDRERLVEVYDQHCPLKLPRLWRLWLHSYDIKQRAKKGIRGQRVNTAANAR